jgi:hypothetical protein
MGVSPLPSGDLGPSRTGQETIAFNLTWISCHCSCRFSFSFVQYSWLGQEVLMLMNEDDIQ